MTRHALATLVLLALAGAGCRSHDAAPDVPQVPETMPAGVHATPHAEEDLHVAADTRRDLRVTTAEVSADMRVEQTTEIPGEIRVDEGAYAEVGSPVSGRVAALHAQTGRQVRAGDRLAEIRSLEVGRARADYATAVARQTLARQAVARAQALVAERIAPARELQQAEADLSAADADLLAAGTVLKALGSNAEAAAGADVSSLTLRAPIAGVVLERAAAVGQPVEPSATLFRLANLSRVWLVVQAAEQDGLRVRAGTPVQVTIQALPGATRPGRVIWIGQSVNPESHTLPLRIELPNPDGQLRPGMTGRARVPLANTSGRVLTVPATALQRLADAWVAFVPRGDDEWHFEVRTVGRGRDLGGAVEILSGLRPGERVVVDGSFVLKAEAEKARGGARPAHIH